MNKPIKIIENWSMLVEAYDDPQTIIAGKEQ